MSNYIVEQKKEKAQKVFEAILKTLKVEEPNYLFGMGFNVNVLHSKD